MHVLLLLQLEHWAAAAPCQVLTLADAVMWTKAATGALQQLSAGNSRALRSLYEAASLRLETVSAALRAHSTLDQPAPDHAAVGVVPAAAAQPAASNVASAANDRPPTPDMSDTAAKLKSRGNAVCSAGAQHSGKGSPLPDSSRKCSSAGSTACGASGAHNVVCGSSSAGGASCGANTAPRPGRHPLQQLSQQQVLGLQALASAAACHREVAAALVATGADGITSFEWGKQLQHYWQADNQELQVRRAYSLLLMASAAYMQKCL